MRPIEQADPLDMSAVLTSTGTPFSRASYDRGAVLWRQGDASDRVGFIEGGQAQLAVISRGGREAICGLLGAGSFLGEEAMLRAEVVVPRYRHTVTAIVPTQVLVVATAEMDHLLQTHPAVSERFLAHLVARHLRLKADLADQLIHSAEQRLARVLLLLAQRDARHPCQCVLPRVSQAVLAEMVGTTRSRVNIFMRKFKRLGFIDADGRTLQLQRPLRQEPALDLNVLKTTVPAASRTRASARAAVTRAIAIHDGRPEHRARVDQAAPATL